MKSSCKATPSKGSYNLVFTCLCTVICICFELHDIYILVAVISSLHYAFRVKLCLGVI